jgi:hypothetical protein
MADDTFLCHASPLPKRNPPLENSQAASIGDRLLLEMMIKWAIPPPIATFAPSFTKRIGALIAGEDGGRKATRVAEAAPAG